MKIITVVSAKGGVGKSTFCTCVGKMLAIHDKRVLLVDMDIGVRSLDIILGVADETVFNWGDVLVGNCDFRKAVLSVKKNLYVLPAPLDFSDEYTTEGFSSMLERYKDDFDYILLDSPAGIEKGFSLSTTVCDSCIVVSVPDIVSIRAASYACQRARKIGVSDVRLVINRFDKKLHKNLNIDDVIDTVGARLLGVIPESAELSAVTDGKDAPYDCRGNNAINRISQRMGGSNVPLRIKKL